MNKSIKIFFIIFVSTFILFFIFFVIWIFKFSPEALSRNKFINDFNLQLIGKITNVSINKDGQTLVCLKVLETNHKNYFPIHNPNEGNEINNFWENRFFIKVQDSLAVFICDNTSSSSVYNVLKKNSYVVINRNNNKAFEVFENHKTNIETDIGLKIQTFPIRDNIEQSCLGVDYSPSVRSAKSSNFVDK